MSSQDMLRQRQQEISALWDLYTAVQKLAAGVPTKLKNETAVTVLPVLQQLISDLLGY